MTTASIARAALATLSRASASVFARFGDRPITGPWSPGKWRTDDSAGSADHARVPADVKRALGVITQFKTATHAKDDPCEIRFATGRGRTTSLTGNPNGGPFGKDAFVFHDEMPTTGIGPVGTRFDGPGRAGVVTAGDVTAIVAN